MTSMLKITLALVVQTFYVFCDILTDEANFLDKLFLDLVVYSTFPRLLKTA